ncbi:Asparagine synthetase [glutamine-hydrolyzing] 1 [Symmachiella dynata]|uniref:asparagine synthase (glutamine-hydrolyzing) n=1 Tax=Symmachiella dynata TaxID=2527995 RepID=UPI00118CAC73|nr:asparagine synthase (glutamine-hydrolyzing) [Symmachiella dynata]QDT46425.1 Asparagine synthetase [glutamine-hydrolyzing] 1 [Symmachiella dynata]
MCGITGIYYRDKERPAEETVVRAMCDAIVHRGPDDQGQFVDANVGIGMRRLSIIDLAGGHQPMFNDDQSIAIVFNGEIFNCVELRKELESHGHRFRSHSDTEVLVRGYEQWGDDLPKRLNGMFAFSILDRRRHRVLIARDHIGIKPLYLYEDGGQIAWASEIKALLKVPGITAELDRAAMFDFLQFGYVPAPRTMFAGISKLEPATCLVIENGQTKSWKYWELDYTTEQHSLGDWCEQLRELLEDAVRLQLMSDVPLGAFLSGGLDSSSIVAMMHELGVGNISTYAIGFGGEDAFHNELSKAAIVAKKFETDHHEIVVEPNVTELMYPLIEHLDEPITDTSFLVTYLVSKMARESVTVILSGVGGDEIFGGYRRYLGPRLQSMYQMVPGAVRRGMVMPLLNRVPVDRGSAVKSMLRYARGFASQAELPPPDRYQGYVSVYNNGQRHGILSPELAELETHHRSRQVADYYAAAGSHDPLNQMMYADLKTSLVDSLLAFTDKMSMAVSLEARVPLLDYRLVEMAARIPSSMKLRGMRGMKHIFKESMRGRLPDNIITQKKQGFGTPISRWFRSSLQPLLQDVLSRERIQSRGYFDADAVTALMDDHMQQRADHSEHILALLTFEIWHQVYLD